MEVRTPAPFAARTPTWVGPMRFAVPAHGSLRNVALPALTRTREQAAPAENKEVSLPGTKGPMSFFPYG